MVNTDKHHVAMPRLYDLGDATTQPDMYHLEVTRSSVKIWGSNKQHPNIESIKHNLLTVN